MNYYRTIMGYNEINYYSNPRVNHPTLGPLGVEGRYDMARLITDRRKTIAGVGDESGTCLNYEGSEGRSSNPTELILIQVAPLDGIYSMDIVT